jgi:hypothetical protein
MTKGRLQECGEGLLRHLAGAHGELAMADAAKPANMTIDRNVIWRIREDEIGALGLQEMMEGLGKPGIAAQKPMPIKEPEVAVNRRPTLPPHRGDRKSLNGGDYIHKAGVCSCLSGAMRRFALLLLLVPDRRTVSRR